MAADIGNWYGSDYTQFDVQYVVPCSYPGMNNNKL